jgi:hypothetical protein
MRASWPTVTLLLLALVVPARAADTGVVGQKIVLKSRGATQKIVFTSKDPLLPFPPIGSADDPSTGGATIDLVTPGATGTLSIPAGVGNPGWKTKDAAVDSYAYKSAGAVRSVSLKQGRVLKITTRTVPVAMTAPLGSVGLRLTMGSTRTCALFDAPTVVADVPGNFTARNAAAPSDCTNVTLGGVVACGDGLIEGAETCEPTNDAACPGSCTDCTCDVCGNGAIEPSEACEASDDSACPGHCVDCACEPFCGDDTIDPGEVCDGTAFDSNLFQCTSVFGPACMPDCSGCCSIAFCEGDECCPGYSCARRIGPGARECRKACASSGGISGNPACDPGDLCMTNVCLTPHCTSNAQCAPGQCLGGLCCLVISGELVCE